MARPARELCVQRQDRAGTAGLSVIGTPAGTSNTNRQHDTAGAQLNDEARRRAGPRLRGRAKRCDGHAALEQGQ